MERRRGERRRQKQDVAVERRERDRRLHRGNLSALGYTAVRFDTMLGVDSPDDNRV